MSLVDDHSSSVPMEIHITRDTYSSEDVTSPPVYAVGQFYRPLVSPISSRPGTSETTVHEARTPPEEQQQQEQTRPELSKRNSSKEVFTKLRRKLKFANLKRSVATGNPADEEHYIPRVMNANAYIVAQSTDLDGGLPPRLVCGNIVYVPVDGIPENLDTFSAQSSPIAPGPSIYRVQEFDAELPPYEDTSRNTPVIVRAMKKWIRRVRAGVIFRKDDGTVDWVGVAGLLGAVAIAGVLIMASVVFILLVV